MERMHIAVIHRESVAPKYNQEPKTQEDMRYDDMPVVREGTIGTRGIL